MMGDRNYLTGLEVEQLIAAVKGSRNETRGLLVRSYRCLLLLVFRHGLRVAEADGLECSYEKACHNRHGCPMLFLLEILYKMDFWSERKTALQTCLLDG